LLAYCGAPHVSLNANNQWVRQFMAGKNRGKWEEIAMLTRHFIAALSRMDIPSACAAMNRETRIRTGLTPDVLDDAGKALAKAAGKHSCGARFAGAGGGGCVWALGEENAIADLKGAWEKILAGYENAALLDASLDFKGLCRH
jgi:D-glycero-alpha-D-manno-heptose-7-phosphate kinase